MSKQPSKPDSKGLFESLVDTAFEVGGDVVDSYTEVAGDIASRPFDAIGPDDKKKDK